MFHKQLPLVFPWRNHSTCQLLIDGEQFYPVILNAIAQAKSHIFIEMYLVESGKIAEAFVNHLTQQSLQGVTVKLLFDDFGANKFSGYDRERLTKAGVELVFYNPVIWSRFKRSLHRTHRKIIVIDNKIAFTGGAGITDSFIGKHAWRETMIQIRGEVVTDWQQLFLDNLQHTRKKQALRLTSSDRKTDNKKIKDASSQARVVYSNGGARIELKRSLLKHIRHSKQNVWLSTAYFIPSRKIRRALRHAASHGKDVRLLLPREVTDHPAIVHASRRYYAKLLRHGVRIYEYQGRFMHAKVALIDDWSSIGSSNMDRWNLLWNLEANQEVNDSDLAIKVKTMMLNDFNHSKEIIYQEWLYRSHLQRMKEWIWGKVDRWLARWRDDK